MREQSNLTKEIRKAMIDYDITPSQIGEGSASTWYARIKDPMNMRVKDLQLLVRRIDMDRIKVLESIFPEIKHRGGIYK